MLAFLAPTVYIQVSPERVTMRNPKTGASVSEAAVIALAKGGGGRQVTGIGNDALKLASVSVRVLKPFSHPRSLVSDFLAGEHLLKTLLQQMASKSPLAVSPKAVLHLRADPEGGFTQVEVRAFSEMARGAGASRVVVWQGRELTDQELLAGKFPAAGRVLQ